MVSTLQQNFFLRKGPIQTPIFCDFEDENQRANWGKKKSFWLPGNDPSKFQAKKNPHYWGLKNRLEQFLYGISP
jgi:hypothetical protein